jgi:hypothetical protein
MVDFCSFQICRHLSSLINDHLEQWFLIFLLGEPLICNLGRLQDPLNTPLRDHGPRLKNYDLEQYFSTQNTPRSVFYHDRGAAEK